MFRRSSVMRCSAAALAIVIGASFYPWTDLLAKTKSRTPVTSAVKGLEMSPEELRVRVRALVRPTLGIIEENVDQIIADTSGPSVRRAAIGLKIEMTTTILAAMLRSDPVLALADAWAYVLQIEDLLARPESEARYGQSAQRASEALALCEGQFRAFLASVEAGRFAETFPSTMRRWADRHPIEGAPYRRPPIDSEMAELFASSGAKGVFAALGNLDETMADVMTRMDLYTMYLPRLARWEAELAAYDLTAGIDTPTLSAEFERVTMAVDRIAAVTETMSDLAARERIAAFDAIRGERIALLDAAQMERIAILDALQMERIAILGVLRRERMATLRELEAMVQRLRDRSGPVLHEAVQADIKGLITNIEEMRKRLMVDAGETLVQVVDHAFFRLVQLLLICAALVGLGLALRLFLLRRRRRGRDVA